ncbi:hypothetical protein D9M68_19450 [compost metagenome]
MSVIKTHRGFILDTASNHPAGYIDLPLIDKLYHRMETINNFELDFSYLEDVVAAAKQVLFTRTGKFILLNQLKEHQSNWVMNFSISTLNYINGKTRALALENYRDLMVFHPTDTISVDAGKLIRENDYGWMFEASKGEIIAAWLSQEDGLTDLVVSLYLIAGSLPDGWHEHSAAA